MIYGQALVNAQTEVNRAVWALNVHMGGIANNTDMNKRELEDFIQEHVASAIAELKRVRNQPGLFD